MTYYEYLVLDETNKPTVIWSDENYKKDEMFYRFNPINNHSMFYKVIKIIREIKE